MNRNTYISNWVKPPYPFCDECGGVKNVIAYDDYMTKMKAYGFKTKKSKIKWDVKVICVPCAVKR